MTLSKICFTTLFGTAMAASAMAQGTPLARAPQSDKAKLCEQFARAEMAKASVGSAVQIDVNSKYDEASGFCTVRIQKQGQTPSEAPTATYLRTNQFDPSSTLVQNKMPARNAEWGDAARPNTTVTCKESYPQPDGTILCIPAQTRNGDVLKPTFHLDEKF